PLGIARVKDFLSAFRGPGVTLEAASTFVFHKGEEFAMAAQFNAGQLVRVNLAGMQVDKVTFHAAVTDAVGNIIKQTSQDPPKYLVRLLFSFRGINEVEVPADRIHPG
ncbi:MAG: hypothetical protein WAN14_05515, partial [Candidatus Acidiferrales bacterium]